MGTPVCTISATGITQPSYQDCLTYFQGGLQGIYGSDVYLGPDCQDGQFTAILALALNDANAQCVASYNCYSPSTAQGVGLSSIVKTNGIARAAATYSSAPLNVIGQAGTVILNGVAGDGTYKWALPASVTIPSSGVAAVSAICTTIGAIAAQEGTITTIATPTKGWQQVTNPSDAVPGAPVEADAALRARQAQSTALPAQTVLDGIVGAILALPGVTAVVPYENDTDIPDTNSLPGNSVALLVTGGDDTDVATTINNKKTPGCGTYGTTSVMVTNAYGITRTIRFFRPSTHYVTFLVTLKAAPNGYTPDVAANIQSALAGYVNGLSDGDDCEIFKAAVAIGNTNRSFTIVSLAAARDGLSPTPADVPCAFDEVLRSDPSYVTIKVVSS